jgi:hypothetical protein
MSTFAKVYATAMVTSIEAVRCNGGDPGWLRRAHILSFCLPVSRPVTIRPDLHLGLRNPSDPEAIGLAEYGARRVGMMPG